MIVVLLHNFLAHLGFFRQRLRERSRVGGLIEGWRLFWGVVDWHVESWWRFYFFKLRNVQFNWWFSVIFIFFSWKRTMLIFGLNCLWKVVVDLGYCVVYHAQKVFSDILETRFRLGLNLRWWQHLLEMLLIVFRSSSWSIVTSQKVP